MDATLTVPLATYFSWKPLPELGLNEIVPLLGEGPMGWNPVLPEQLLGVEIEVEKASTNSINDYIPSSWVRQEADGSLRNNGVELITCAHKAQYTENLLYQIYKRLPKGHDFSARTSIHVHFNVRDFTNGQLLTLLYSYLVVERLLYKWVGEGREKSIFCVPVQETLLPRNIIDVLIVPKYLHWMKYTGLNLLPVLSQGTVEFRHLYGCKDYRVILDWINMILCIIKYAKETHPERAHERILGLNTTSEYTMFLADLIPVAIRTLMDTPDYTKLMEKGVAYIKAVSYRNHFQEELVNMATKSSDAYKRVFGNEVSRPAPRVKIMNNPFLQNNPTMDWQTLDLNLNTITTGTNG